MRARSRALRGRYGRDFTKLTSGFINDDVMGLLSYQDMHELETSLELATLPGIKRKR